MKRNRMTVLIVFALALLMVCAALPAMAEEHTQLTIYEGPKTMTSSKIATVSANG